MKQKTEKFKDVISKIIELILKNQKITRDDLASQLHKQKTAILSHINYLEDLGVIQETSIKTSEGSGRKPTYLEFNPEFCQVLAINIKKNKIITAFIDLKGNVSKLKIQKNQKQMQKSSTINLILEIIKEYSTYKSPNFIGVAIALGGSIDSENGISNENLFIKNWKNVPLANIIQKETGKETIIIKDIEALALGEHYFGKGLGKNNLISINLSYDVGMGIIANGQLYRGASSCAGELGHIIVDPNGPLCYCGRAGCLEKMVSAETTIDNCKKGLKQGVQSMVLGYINDDINSLSIQDIIKAANNNDVFCKKLFTISGKYIGDKLSEVVNLFNPDILCLRGSLINNNEFLYNQIREYILSYSRSYNISNLTITFPKEEEYLELKGAASSIFSQLLSYLSLSFFN